MKSSSLVAAVAIGLLCANAVALDNQKPQTLLGNKTQMQSPQDINKAKGEAFLAANKTKPGVITLPDGLQYKIIVNGNGSKPSLSDSVTVHYSGTLIDGTEFDSSYKRKAPATFPLTGVIPGWTEALQLMNVGSTWNIYIPSALAYGLRGASSAIGPNETLIFKVELLSINKP